MFSPEGTGHEEKTTERVNFQVSRGKSHIETPMSILARAQVVPDSFKL